MLDKNIFKCFKTIKYQVIFAEPFLFFYVRYFILLFIMVYTNFHNLASTFLFIINAFNSGTIFLAILRNPPSQRPFYVYVTLVFCLMSLYMKLKSLFNHLCFSPNVLVLQHRAQHLEIPNRVLLNVVVLDKSKGK